MLLRGFLAGTGIEKSDVWLPPKNSPFLLLVVDFEMADSLWSFGQIVRPTDLQWAG